MTEKHKIPNLEAHTRYVKMFKSNTEAARQFLVDEGLKKGKKLEKKWAFCFLSLRSKWIKMNKGKSKRSEATIRPFQNFQEEVFYKAMDSSSAEACALVDTSMSELVIDSSDIAMGNQPSTSTCSSGRNSVCLWKEGAPSSPEAGRPILLAVGKEDKDLLNKLVPPVISSLQSNGVTITIAGQEYSLKVKFIRSIQNDVDAILAEQIVEGFEIGEVDVKSLRALYEVDAFSVNTFPILHALLRDLDYCLKLVCKLSAGVDEWKENSQTKAKAGDETTNPQGETEGEIKTPEMEVPKAQQPAPVQSECPEPVQKELPLPVNSSRGTITQSELI
eukprot:Em0022g396a